MALFTEKFLEDVVGQVAARQQKVGRALGQPSNATPTSESAGVGPLQERLRLLMQIANGEMLRTDASKAELHRVEEALQYVLQMLLGSPLYPTPSIPDDFWQSDPGVLASRVRWWLSADELITISNAAALAFGKNTQANRMKIVRAIDKGLLDWVPDPSVANPQHNRRVLRPQVERLGEERRRPE